MEELVERIDFKNIEELLMEELVEKIEFKNIDELLMEEVVEKIDFNKTTGWAVQTPSSDCGRPEILVIGKQVPRTNVARQALLGQETHRMGTQSSLPAGWKAG